MEQSFKQLYNYGYNMSNALIDNILKSAGNTYFQLGMQSMSKAEQDEWNQAYLKETIEHFVMAKKLCFEDAKIIALANICLCYYHLKDNISLKKCKQELQDIEFSEKSKKFILNLGADPTGFKTLYRAIKSLITGEEYKNRYTVLAEKMDHFQKLKQEAIKAVADLKLE